MAHYTLPLAASRLAMSAGFNYNKTQITNIAPNPQQDALHGLVLPIVNRQEQGFLTSATPLTKTFILADWDVGHWVVHGQITRYGHWDAISSNGPKYDQTFGARYILDASLTYHWSGWQLTAGSNDIGNTYPQQNNSLNNFSGIFPYPFSSPFGFNGAYYYGTVAYRWN